MIDPAALSGLAFLEAMVAGHVPGAAIGTMMEMRAHATGPGWMEFRGNPGPQHYNPMDTVHGGYAATLLDSCMALAVVTTLPAGMLQTTVDLTVSYLRPMTEATGQVIARGDVISSGRRIATARGSLVDADGRILATGTCTCLVFAREAPRQ